MTLFLLVDVSGSMSINGNIGKVNSAIEEMIPLLADVSNTNADAEIRIAVLAFSSGCVWVTHDASGQEGPESLESFFWNDMEAGGLTDMGAAFIELESRLSRSSFLKSSTGAYAPVLILLSDGEPTDNWEAGLEKLRHNNWYKCATKIAIAVDNGDTSVLTAFTGTTESVLKVNSNRDDLKKLLCRLAVVASSMQSRSVSAGSGGDDEEQAKQRSLDAIQNTVQNIPGDSGSQPGLPETKDADLGTDPDDDIWGSGW